MIPNAREIAARVVGRVLGEDAWGAALLRAELDRYPQLDARERAFATELTFGTLRTARYLLGRVSRHAHQGIDRLNPTLRAHLLVGTYQLVCLERVAPYAVVASTVELVKRDFDPGLAGLTNALLRKVSTDVSRDGHVSVADAVLQGAPRWLRRALDASLGQGQADLFLSAGPFPPAVGLRIRPVSPGESVTKEQRDEWIKRYQEALPEAEVTAGQLEPSSVLIRQGGDSRHWPGVAEGLVMIQEEGSLHVATKVGAKASERVLDTCAGRGHKTLALADIAGPTATICALDVDGRKLEHLKADAALAKITNVECSEVDVTVGLGDLVPASFDRVLVDAPCSGVGTLRRRPEILLRRTENDLKDLQALQRALITKATTALKPKGSLIYAVCSVLKAELEDVISGVEGLECVEIERVTPHQHGTDGYAIARLVKT